MAVIVAVAASFPNNFDPIEHERVQAISQLSILQTLTQVYGWLVLLCSCMFGIYLFLGIGMMTNPAAFASKNDDPRAAAFGGPMFLAIGIFGVVATWTVGSLTLYASKCIRLRRHWTFVFVLACIMCLNAPLGTALGVYLLVVLSRASVRPMFDSQPIQ